MSQPYELGSSSSVLKSNSNKNQCHIVNNPTSHQGTLWGRGRSHRRCYGSGPTFSRHTGRGRSRPTSFHHNHNMRDELDSISQDALYIEEINIPFHNDSNTTSNSNSTLRIAIQGCCHGCLDRIYSTLQAYTKRTHHTIDLLLCCGDFQSMRNESDLQTFAAPHKYRKMGSFHSYYAGTKLAPILTIFIGGNHEASASLQELYYGGWVAPNIYYLGAVGVLRYRGLRIAGISGIYKEQDYYMGRYEAPPYDGNSLRSVYHVRAVDIARLKCLATSSNRRVIDILLSHDWPNGIERHGDTSHLLRKKKHFQKEIHDGTLGNPANREVMRLLKPKWWFAAHLHVKFRAWYRHEHDHDDFDGCGRSHTDITDTYHHQTDSSNMASFVALESSHLNNTNHLTDQITHFLSLDKCLPRRQHLQVLNIPSQPKNNHSCNDSKSSMANNTHETSVSTDGHLRYDLEWLAILQKTHHWTNVERRKVDPPDISKICITERDIENIRLQLQVHQVKRKKKDLLNSSTNNDDDDPTIIPHNFSITVLPHGTIGSNTPVNQGCMVGSPQTDELLAILGLDHVLTVPYIYGDNQNHMNDTNEIDIEDDNVSINEAV